MAVIIRLQQAHKAYGEQVLLDHIDAEFTDTRRYGFVGRNGTGKSTLLKIILGDEELDSGAIHRSDGARIAYLSQHDDFTKEDTVLSYLMRTTNQPDWRCGEVAAQFAIKGERLTSLITSLSGGWQTRVKLTGMLLGDPDFLILDEPTNFLDIRTQILLENFLKDWRGGSLIVSHDRRFLSATCSSTVALSRGAITIADTDIHRFLEQQEEVRQRLLRENESLRSKQKQLQTFVDKNRANANTASQARSKAKQLERLTQQLHDIDEHERRAAMVVPQVDKRSGPALHVEELQIGYAGHPLTSPATFSIDRGERVAIMGDNGQGKTTLLKTLSDAIPAVSGSFNWTHGTDIGVYGQHVFGTLPDESTVRAYLESKALPGTERTTILGVAGGMLFHGDAVEKPIKVLSGGERARLVLGGLLLGKHTVLMLDEPTNHLDVDSVQVMAEALQRYQGTIIFVSHDRDFAASIATGVAEIADGTINYLPGEFDNWLYRLEQELSNNKTPAATKPASTRKPANGKRIHEIEKRLKNLDKKIEKLGKEEESLRATLADCEDASKSESLVAKLEQQQGQRDQCEEEWLTLQEELESLTSE